IDFSIKQQMRGVRSQLAPGVLGQYNRDFSERLQWAALREDLQQLFPNSTIKLTEAFSPGHLSRAGLREFGRGQGVELEEVVEKEVGGVLQKVIKTEKHYPYFLPP